MSEVPARPDEMLIAGLLNQLYAEPIAGGGALPPMGHSAPLPSPQPGSAPFAPAHGMTPPRMVPHGELGGLAGQGHLPVHGVPAIETGSVRPQSSAVAPPGLPQASARREAPADVAQLPRYFGDVSDQELLQKLQFTIPNEIDLLPEPAAIFDGLGLPTTPRDPPIPASTVGPYWLEGKQMGKSAEQEMAITRFAPHGFELQPTAVFATVPDKPPERPPEKPPTKSFAEAKLIAMSGQEMHRAKEPAATAKLPDPALPSHQMVGSNFYWAPVLPASGIDPHLPEAAGQPKTPGLQATPALQPIATSAPPAPLATPQFKSGLGLGSAVGFNVDAVRRDFPILQQKVNGKPLVWLDNAATTQKPRAVIDRMVKFYEEENSNVHRAAHVLAARATDAYEAARQKVAKFLGAPAVEEIVFTRGTTESINLLAQTYGKANLGRGDEIILMEYEHHSNIVPWQMLTRETGAVIRVAPILDNGELDLAAYERLFNRRTRMVSIGHVSNALGTVAPVKAMAETAHRHGCTVVVDGAQSVPHFPVNVQDLGADFYVFSGHKLFGPTGIGVMWGRRHLLEDMPPWQGGGNMIQDVTFKHTTYNPPPSRFEAGTASLGPAVGLGAAIDYLDRIGFAAAAHYEDELLHYAQDKIAAIKGVKMIGTARHKAGVLSFVTDTLSPAQLGEILNAEGIAVRVGHHCAQPALAHFGLQATVRPSLAFYNTRDEVDLLVRTVDKALRAAP